LIESLMASAQLWRGKRAVRGAGGWRLAGVAQAASDAVAHRQAILAWYCQSTVRIPPFPRLPRLVMSQVIVDSFFNLVG